MMFWLVVVAILAPPRTLPDLSLTPGAILTTEASVVCVKGYAGKIRNVPESEKRDAYRRYGIATHRPGDFEVDHLISLELGGSNDLTNLWPQSYKGRWNAHDKDLLENRLHHLVCDGTIPLTAAQRLIKTDWIAAFKSVMGSVTPRDRNER